MTEPLPAAQEKGARPVWHPSRELLTGSNVALFMREQGVTDYDALLRRADSDPEWFWGAVLGRLAFHRPYDTLLDESAGAPFARWCDGGLTNVALNCLDRYRDTERWERNAVVWEGEDGAIRQWSYAELAADVSRLADGLRALGHRPGDVVGLYMPALPEAVSAVLAVAKIGGVILPLFSGFGAAALAGRLRDAGAVAVITADATLRRGRTVEMKSVLDEAVAELPAIRNVVVVRRLGSQVPWSTPRDHWYHELTAGRREDAPTEQMPADAPMMLMYTSGTTGLPKGTVHTHCGFAAKLVADLGLVMDLRPTDRLLWLSDMGWLVGPLCAVGVPLMGASLLLAEGAPDYPDAGRMWRLVADHRVSFLGLAPTTVRGFMKDGGGGIERHDLGSLRVVASTGEVWTPDAWHWTFDKVCARRVPILNYSGGTEVGGGILGCPVVLPLRPCAFSRAIPGMQADVTDGAGHPIPDGTVGELVIRGSSPGLTRGLWHDRERYLDSYWRDIPGLWRHGDWARREADGYWFILGRSDDTLKIAGKRTGPSEIETLLMATGKVAECAVIGLPDETKGEAVGCIVVPMPGLTWTLALREELAAAVVAGLGVPYRPKLVMAVDDLPKTRNMKIMRRVVRAACLDRDPGDLSSLVNPETVEAIRASRAAEGAGP